jgi:aminoglycoside phosphotransferase (APT) family kinase protein
LKEARALAPISELTPRLLAFSRASYGPAADVANVRSLGGHSGVTVGFDVIVADQLADELVLKIPPAGVNIKNNFDVLRQVPLLRTLTAQGIPAPQARWWSDDTSIFGVPYLVMSRLKGSPLPDVFGADAGRGVVDAGQQFAEAVAVLAALHAIDAMAELSDWNAVRMMPDEIDHWVQVLNKSRNPAWREQGLAVRELLHRLAPRHSAVGIVHGDFYSNNWIYDRGHLTGVVDWEGASQGPVLLDLGWLCTMYDPESWGPTRRARMGWHPEPDSFIESYAKLSPIDLTDIAWYRALAAYRLACITAYYFEQHRSGRRPNPAWEVLGEAFPFMLDKAARLLNARAAATC